MLIDFRTTNLIWASTVAETLWRLGLEIAVICPGSRSAPLAIAFSQHPQIQTLPCLDERSGAFFALGHAKATVTPVAVICTSGTAGANFYPAVIEAHLSQVPLLLLTGDRPPELQNCHSGQVIDQRRLYGHYPNWQTELALPELDAAQLAYVRQTLIHAWERSRWPVPGPVHLNFPFRDPLAPLPQPEAQAFAAQVDPAAFFAALGPSSAPTLSWTDPLPIERWQNCERGLIIVGPGTPQDCDLYAKAIAQLSTILGWPVLVDGLSPLRNYGDRFPAQITTYGVMLQHPGWAEQLRPSQVIRIGNLPTSKELRQFLASQPLEQWMIDPSDHNRDPLHQHTHHLRTDLVPFVQAIAQQLPYPSLVCEPYRQQWMELEMKLRDRIAQTFSTTTKLWEPMATWVLAHSLPANTPLFIANSMPVRDVEWVWPLNQSHGRPYVNRGANGIDGTLSSALGMAYGQAGVLLTGDLSFLHDINGLLLQPHWLGHLTVVLMNNHGGGIFQMLPIAKFDPPFEQFFVTPQALNIQQLCQAHSVEYEAIPDWPTLASRLNPLPSTGIRVLEIDCDRVLDHQRREQAIAQWLMCKD